MSCGKMLLILFGLGLCSFNQTGVAGTIAAGDLFESRLWPRLYLRIYARRDSISIRQWFEFAQRPGI